MPKEILKKPSKDEFDRKMKEQDEIVNQRRGLIEEQRYKRKLVYEGGKVDGAKGAFRDIISHSIEDVKKFKQEKRSFLDQLSKLKDRQR